MVSAKSADRRPSLRSSCRIRFAIPLKERVQRLRNPAVSKNQRRFGGAVLMLQEFQVMAWIEESLIHAESAIVLSYNSILDDDPQTALVHLDNRVPVRILLRTEYQLRSKQTSANLLIRA